MPLQRSESSDAREALPVTPKISVLMSSYNHAPFVAEAMRSVLNQSFGDFEFLICDDGSTDDTVDVIREFDDPRIVFLGTGPNRGISTRRNELIARSRGQYIAVQNSDDIWASDKLAHQLMIMERRPELGAVFGLASFIDRSGAPQKWPPIFSSENRSKGGWLRRFFEASNCLCDPSVMIRASCYAVIGLNDPRYRQLPDMDMWVRLVKRYPIHISDRVLLSFRITEGAMSFPGVDSETRSLNEQHLIADGMLDDAPHDLIKDGFGDLLVFGQPPTDLHWDVEKALLYLSISTVFQSSYALIGLRRLHGLLASPRHLLVLRDDYGIDHQRLHSISTKATAFSSVYRLMPEVAKLTEANQLLRDQGAELERSRQSHAAEVEALKDLTGSQGQTISTLQSQQDELQRSRQSLTAEVDDLKDLMGRQGQMISDFLSSRSWQITRPLRYLSERARRLRIPR